MEFKKIAIALGGVIIVGIIGIVWWRQYKTGGVDGLPVVIVEDAGEAARLSENVSAEAAEILRAIETLKRINLDTEFFNDERFLDLVDTSITIDPPTEPVRRTLDLFTPEPDEDESN